MWWSKFLAWKLLELSRKWRDKWQKMPFLKVWWMILSRNSFLERLSKTCCRKILEWSAWMWSLGKSKMWCLRSIWSMCFKSSFWRDSSEKYLTNRKSKVIDSNKFWLKMKIRIACQINRNRAVEMSQRNESEWIYIYIFELYINNLTLKCF